MNLLPSFATWQFALAGLVCAGLALAIHIFNRRRQRVVHWAAMDLLQQALRRKRRMIRLRDLLLLILRIAAVLCFGLALAEPYWPSDGRPLDASQPLNAVVLIDNSLSMAYETLEGTLLDRAKQRARRLIQDLPNGSQVCLIPICGWRSDVPLEPMRATEQALELLDRIEALDRAASIRHAVEAARHGSEFAGEMTTRAVLLTDRQRRTWADLEEGLAAADSVLQVVDVSSIETDNCWISDVQVQDGIADTQTPATILARIKHHGSSSRDVQVTLSVDQRTVATESVTLSAVDDQEVALSYRFRARKSNSPLEYERVKVAVSPDLLPLDDERYLMVPLVAQLPALFVDQHGDREEPLSGQVGETRALRRLLSTMAATAQPLAHLRIDQLTRSNVAEARLIVIAGVPAPGDRVPLLRQFVEQGGQLVIAAGANFDPQAWTSAAWLAGKGILPAPLESQPVGDLPAVAERLEPFAISFASIAENPYFQLAGVPETERRELYSQPLFFKAVQLDLAAAGKPPAQRADDPRTTGGAADDDLRWLRWSSPNRTDREQTEDESPRVLARFSNSRETPFLVEQQIGLGRVLFVASGVQSNWNTIARTHAILVFDRILRTMLFHTLPARNFSTQERITLPLAVAGLPPQITLSRPGTVRAVETLDYGFIRHNQRGVAIQRPFRRGVYQLAVTGGQPSSAANMEQVIELAVNGNPSESDLTTMTDSDLAQLASHERLRWVGRDEQINLTGTRVLGQDSWWWLALLTLLVLIVECLLVTGR